MTTKFKIPLWTISGILYGLSWPYFEWINLSWLAWFAFIPLLLYLKNNVENTKNSLLAIYGTAFIYSNCSAFWLYMFPQPFYQVFIVVALEALYMFTPFFVFHFISRKIPFDKALWLLPCIWTLGEWLCLQLEFSMGTHLSPYTQSQNMWLIQYIDITGMWGISFWLMLFNVLLFKSLNAAQYRWSSPLFIRKASFTALAMLAIAAVYTPIAYSKYRETSNKSLQLTLIPTSYSPDFIEDPNNEIAIVEQVLYQNDSIAFAEIEKGKHSDLFVWSEVGLKYGLAGSNLGALLQEAVADWESALISGCQQWFDSSEGTFSHNSGILISHNKEKPEYHHKTQLVPMQEAIPYHSLLAKIPFFPIPLSTTLYAQKGKSEQPLPLITKDNKNWKIGVSLCYEQWYPEYWAQVTENGAELFVHMAGEGWYGHIGFQHFMTNVTKLRSIENRRQVARCANVGISTFIDQFGRQSPVSAKNLTKRIKSIDKQSFYSKHPYLFLVLLFITFSFLYIRNLATKIN